MALTWLIDLISICAVHMNSYLCASSCRSVFRPYIKDYSQFVPADRAIWHAADWNVNKNAPEGDAV